MYRTKIRRDGPRLELTSGCPARGPERSDSAMRMVARVDATISSKAMGAGAARSNALRESPPFSFVTFVLA